MTQTLLTSIFTLLLSGVALAAEGKRYEGFSYLIANLLILIGFGAWAASIASKKGHNYTLWFIIGLLLPFIGQLIAWALPRKRVAKDKGQVQTLKASCEEGDGATEVPQPSILQRTCQKCGHTAFDYDHYYKEYSCKNCGWLIKQTDV